MKGYLDRIEDNGKAVILIEEKDTEIILPLEELPEGSKVKTWFHIEEIDDSFEVLSIDCQTTERNAQRASDLMDQLRKRKKGSKFKK